MAISEFHAAHIREVRVSFLLEAPDLDPSEVTRQLAVNPTSTGRRGDDRRNAGGGLLGHEEHGWWCLSTEGVVDSKDINEHFRYLQRCLAGGREALVSVAPNARAYFDVLWRSTYLYAGTGPLLDAAAIAGVAAWGAGVGFDIYQVDDDYDA